MVASILAEAWAKVDFSRLLTDLAHYAPNVAAAGLILLAFWVCFIVLKRIALTYARAARLPGPVSGLLVGVIKYSVAAIALVTAAAQLKINVASLLTGMGLFGLAVSFAAQDTFANIISGVALVIDRPFKVGDWVEIDGIHAHVSSISLRTTTLSTLDNQTIVMPNKLMSQQRVINYTLMPRIRVRVPFGIAYKEDIRAARQVVLATLGGDGQVLAEPAPEVVVTGLGSSSVDMELRFWLEDASLQHRKLYEYTEKCKYALDEAGIEIPFPHLQLFVEKSEGLSEGAARLSGA